MKYIITYFILTYTSYNCGEPGCSMYHFETRKENKREVFTDVDSAKFRFNQLKQREAKNYLSLTQDIFELKIDSTSLDNN